MFGPVNGLFGWVDSNNKRSVLLFAVFLVLFQLMTVPLTLALGISLMPMLLSWLSWGHYFLVILPLSTIIGALCFAVQYFWHVQLMTRRLGFHFVDGKDEPRLCRIVEPLLIAAGIPTPYVGVIETEARNAFACGVMARLTVIVVTRGLIDNLNDDELAAVVAHEIAHIRNGDTRLMAVVNIMVDTIALPRRLMRRRFKAGGWKLLPAVAVSLTVPVMMVGALVVGLISQLGYWFTCAVRLGIGSAREFMADAEAARLTQNPAALVSALQKVGGYSQLAGAGADYSSMMIDGESEGTQASHPRLDERIAAIIRMTGSMVFNGPSQWRDSRPAAQAGFGRRAAIVGAAGLMPAAVTIGAPHRPSLLALVRRVAAHSESNIFGLPRWSNWLLLGWAGLLFAIHGFSPESVARQLVPHRLDDIPAAPATHACGQNDSGQTMCLYGGKVVPADAVVQADAATRVAAKKCYATITVESPGAPEQGWWPLDRTESNASADLFSGLAESAGPKFLKERSLGVDEALRSYIADRETGLTLLANYYGPPGVTMGLARLKGDGDVAALKALGERLNDPEYAAKLSPQELAEYRLLARNPDDFVPCKVR